MILRGAVRAATIALFATAASVASPSRASAQNLTCERGDVEVRGVEFRGNRAISDGDLDLRVGTTPSSRARRTFRIPLGQKRCLNRAQLGQDIESVKDYYRQRGFYRAQVDTVVREVSPGAVRVEFLIAEGAPMVLGRYEVTGLDSVQGAADIRRRLRLRVGEPFDFNLYLADIDTIIGRLRDAGYYRADHVWGYSVDTSASQRAEAFITVLPGARARFGSHVFDITPIEGAEPEIDTAVVRRIMGISTGQPYSDRAILEAQRNLFQLAAYRHVDVTPLPDSLQPPGDTIVRLIVRLSEDYMRQIDSEFGWATLDCARMRLQYTDKNLFGTARRLELAGQASKIGYGYPLATESTRDVCTFNKQTPLWDDPMSDSTYYFGGIGLRQPRLLGTRWVPAVSLYSERRGEYKAYMRTTLIGGDLSATREVRDRTSLRLGYTFEYGSTLADAPALCALFNVCDPDSRQRIGERLPLGVASAALVRIRTDNPVSPTRGTLFRSEIRSSATPLLGTSDSLYFNKLTGDLAWYTPVGSNVLTLRVRGGMVLGRTLALADSGLFVPPQERLYAGGPTSVRGFQQNELGSVVYIADRGSDVDSTVTPVPGSLDSTIVSYQHRGIGPSRTVPLGGNSLIVANIEYRIRDPFLFPNALQYTLFIDGGDVWSRSDRGFAMKWTPGFGIRALTPIGPVQVNVGYNSHDRDKGAIYYNPNVFTLACASPGNAIQYHRRGPDGPLEQIGSAACDQSYDPPIRDRWYKRLTFTFSIGPEF
ncbi:MAG: BamA/OMP85 family outer membrane protein [Gemmatimonadaceae bacterium]